VSNTTSLDTLRATLFWADTLADDNMTLIPMRDPCYPLVWTRQHLEEVPKDEPQYVLERVQTLTRAPKSAIRSSMMTLKLLK